MTKVFQDEAALPLGRWRRNRSLSSVWI